jgi:hypothetical protein
MRSCVDPLRCIASSETSPTAGVGVLVVTLVWLSASHLFAFYQRDAMEDWRDATRYVLAATHPGDVVAFFPLYAKQAI